MMRWHLTRSRSLQTVCRAMQAGVLLLCLWVSPSLAQIVQPLGRIGNADLGARRAIGLTDFGISMANVGDLNGDGTPDVAVLSHRGDSQQGALWLLFLNPDGTVNDRSRLSAATDERLPRVFGWGLASLGDVDGNGSVELAVTGVTTGQSLDRARLDQLWLLSLSPGGQLTDVVPVLLPQPLSTAPHRVHSLAAAGDIDGDGRSELALGVTNETSGERFGLLFFLKEGAVRTYQAYRPGQGALRGLGDRSGLIDFRGFGESVASVGDLDGNGVPDLAIGAVSASGTYPRQGGVVILFLQRDGTMLIARAITEGQGGFTDALQASAGFGGALANVGDLDGDGRAELAVAATRYDGLLEDQGAVWILSLGPEGRVIRQQRIGPGTGGFAGYLPPLARFGFSLAGLGDLDGDGTPDLMVRVKRPREDLGERGGLWTLFLEPDGSTRHQQAIHAEAGGLANALSNQDYFGAHAIRVGDVDGNGVVDLAVGAPGDDVDGKDQGALWILLMDNNGRVMQHQKVSGRDDRFPSAPVSKSSLGMHMVPVGDVDGDGVPDLVASRAYMLRLDSNRGLAWLLLLERTGRLKQAFTLASIDDQFGGGDSSAAPIAYRQYRQNGKNLARLGDLDGNGVTDLLLRTGPLSTTVLFLGADGQSLREQPLSIEELGIPAGEAMPDDYHYQLYSAGDFDGDGRETVALVSTPHNDQPKPLTVRLIDFDASGTVERSTQLPLEGLNLRPATLQQFQQWYEQQIIEGYPWKERFEWQEGLRVYPAGDLDGDAVPDLALVVYPALLNTPEQGNIWQVYMTRAGTVKRLRRLPLQTARPPGQPASATGNAVTSVVRLDAAALGTQPVLGLGRPFDNRDGRGRGTLDIVQLAPAYTAWLPRLGYGVLALGGLVVVVALAGRVQTRRLRRQNEALEQVVQERTAEVAAQADALQRANDLKAHFLANISHEFRTPLTLTFGPIRDLLQGHYESFEDAQPHFERAQHNGQRLLRLIDQLLDLSKMDAGSLALHLQRIDGAQLVRQIVGLFASLAERQGLDLHVDAPEHLPMTCDPDHLEKMLVNLISNAFKFTPEGGRVTVTLRIGGDQAAILTVTDTGSGISPEEQWRIFDRFYQVDGAARRTREGTGIGLSLVKELVTLHEGVINVASSEGRGTTFTITLPYHDVPPEPEAADAQAYGDGARPEVAEIERAVAEVPDVQPQAVSADAPVVLLVEDHADLRAYIRSHLDPSFVILEAANGADGLALALEQVPDLILSDVMMSEMDGYTLLDALKQDQRTSHIPVVLLTARADVDSRIAGLERGADAYLAKPFDAGELRACLRGLIAQRQHLRQLWHTALAQPPTAQSEAATGNLPVAERQFVAQVDALIETHYTDPHFNTDTLAEGLGLTARQLRRKLKALTGQRPGKRLRHYRLEAAYEQLRTPDASVKAVVYAVGYTSPSHFSKQFKQAYGITPSQHRDAQAPPEPD